MGGGLLLPALALDTVAFVPSKQHPLPVLNLGTPLTSLLLVRPHQKLGVEEGDFLGAWGC